jgi:hypothetical protein
MVAWYLGEILRLGRSYLLDMVLNTGIIGIGRKIAMRRRGSLRGIRQLV